MNTNTSTEGNGKKELKITQTNDADKLIDKYFEEFINEYDKYPNLSRDAREDIEYVLSTHAINFRASEQSIKVHGGEENENGDIFSGINVLESGKRDFVLEEIAKGAGLKIKPADLRKVKAKADKIRKEDADRKRREDKETDDIKESDDIEK